MCIVFSPSIFLWRTVSYRNVSKASKLKKSVHWNVLCKDKLGSKQNIRNKTLKKIMALGIWTTIVTPLVTQIGEASVLSLSELNRVQSLIYPAKILFRLSVSNPIKKLKLKKRKSQHIHAMDYCSDFKKLGLYAPTRSHVQDILGTRKQNQAADQAVLDESI